jgi:hypothetical protein
VVFVVKLDVARIFFSDRNVRHFESPLYLLLCVPASTRRGIAVSLGGGQSLSNSFTEGSFSKPQFVRDSISIRD